MENKQTAVEWLVKMLYSPVCVGFIQGRKQIPNHIIEQAKQMQKEQMEEFYNEGEDFSTYVTDEIYGGVESWEREPMGFEQYYKEKYGK
jgi:hypothetical protein